MPHKQHLVRRLVQVVPMTANKFDARLVVGFGQFCKSSFHPVEESLDMIWLFSDGQHEQTIGWQIGLCTKLCRTF